MGHFLKFIADMKYALLTISGSVVAYIPGWVHEMSEWAQVFAKIGGFIAVGFGILKMIDQFLLQRRGINLLGKKKHGSS